MLLAALEDVRGVFRLFNRSFQQAFQVCCILFLNYSVVQLAGNNKAQFARLVNKMAEHQLLPAVTMLRQSSLRGFKVLPSAELLPVCPCL